MIPAPLRAWLKDIADRGCFPLEYPAAAAIVGISGLIGRRIGIRPKRNDDWQVIPNLWGAIVGPPGIQKSPAIDEALRPLKRLAAAAIEAHEQELHAYEEEKLVSEAKKLSAKKNLEKAAKSGSSDDDLLDMARAALTDDVSSPPAPRRFLVNDATVEKLGELLRDNPNGLTFFRDELVGLLKTMDRQGHEGDRGFLLEAWNGNGSYTWDRIGRGTVHIPTVCLAVFGSIQPGPLSRYLRASISGEEADGFMPRFQLLFYPDPPPKFVNVDRFPSHKARTEAYAVFQALNQLAPGARGCAFDQEGDIPYVKFSSVAQDFFDGWREELENRLRSAALSNVMKSHLAKYRSLLPSLALIFHLIDSHVDAQIDPVSLETVMLAAAWCELLEAHACRVYQCAMDGNVDDAIKLAEKLAKSLPNPFTCRQVAQKGWSGLDTVEVVRRAVGILEDRGWVQVIEVPSDDKLHRGRPSEQVWIHPKLLPEVKGVGA
jgi:putative DNA primase/helicase